MRRYFRRLVNGDGCRPLNQRRRSSTSASCPFETLGVDRKNATISDVKDAYRDLCKIHHPDVGGSEEKFKDIQGAYEKCKERIESGFVENVDEYENQSSNNAAEGCGTSDRDHDEKRYDEYRAAKEEEMRQSRGLSRDRFRERFQHVSHPDAVDELLIEAIASDVFSSYDIGEPLALALDRYHHGIPLGDEHITRCFQGMKTWEDSLRKKCSCVFYHMLLTHYTTEAFLHHCDAMTVTQSVERVMERMTEQGLPHDDWTISIANRAFRQLPFPDW